WSCSPRGFCRITVRIPKSLIRTRPVGNDIAAPIWPQASGYSKRVIIRVESRRMTVSAPWPPTVQAPALNALRRSLGLWRHGCVEFKVSPYCDAYIGTNLALTSRDASPQKPPESNSLDDERTFFL